MTELTRRSLLAGTAAAAALPLAGIVPTDAAAPLSGKQAPGFYRYKVGTMEVTAVTDGLTIGPLSDTYVANASKDAVNAALEAGFMARDRATQPYTPVVVNTGGKLVVIDTGLGPAMLQQSKGTAGQFQTNLAAAGIDRMAVDAVVISNFHGDHINGLIGPDGGAAYPNAEVMVPAAEYKFWMDDGNMSRAADAAKPAFQNARRVFGVVGSKVTQYDPGKDVAPGITSVSSPGHTVGHCSYIVAAGSDRVLVQVDITAGMAQLFVRNPEWQFGFDMDKQLAVQTRRKLYDMAVAEKMLVQGFHFPFPGIANIEKDGNGYRLVPIFWNPTI